MGSQHASPPMMSNQHTVTCGDVQIFQHVQIFPEIYKSAHISVQLILELKTQSWHCDPLSILINAMCSD